VPISLVGRASSSGVTRRAARGVTLVELLIVMTIVALLAGLTYPSAAAGLDSVRLRSTASQVASFLNTAMELSDRRQQVVEIRISPAEDSIGARSADSSFARAMTLPNFIVISSVEPALVNASDPNEQRRFLLYPGGTLPRIAIGLESKDGRKRRVVVDPATGTPRSEALSN
jgi:prepilin-type N-terminal cleavage/methylation domain-containing protein